jgi:hypothetical protein
MSFYAPAFPVRKGLKAPELKIGIIIIKASTSEFETSNRRKRRSD